VAEDAPIETALGAHPAEAVDVEVEKITKEKQSISNGLTTLALFVMELPMMLMRGNE
jgi:hypothetical protein